jgi:hypothetical protein
MSELSLDSFGEKKSVQGVGMRSVTASPAARAGRVRPVSEACAIVTRTRPLTAAAHAQSTCSQRSTR